MSRGEVEGFLQESIAMYAGDLEAARGIDRVDALALAREQLTALLPEGVDTPGHEFCWITHGQERVGRIWFGVYSRDEVLYVYDVAIDVEHRGQGYAAGALDEVIARARRDGVAAIGLSVFDDNPRARGLYESRGFREVGAEDGQTEMRLDL